MTLNHRFAAFVLFALVTVEFGGWSLLGFLTGAESLSPFQEQFFRAGHGHAGVLLVLALVFFVLMERTRYRQRSQLWLGITLLLGSCSSPAGSSSTCCSVRKAWRHRAPGQRGPEPSCWRSR